MTDGTGSTDSDVAAVALDVWLEFLGQAPNADDVEFEELCLRRPELARELRRLAAAPARVPPCDPVPVLAAVSPHRSTSIRLLLARLEPRALEARYRDEGLIARGGMGAVRRVWDVELDRALAMKVLLADEREPSAQRGREGSEDVLRFLEEARLNGQLDHPGIVPVHELGIDSQGRLFFTMKLIEGRDLRRIFELAWGGEEGWSTTRAVAVLLKVCEAMAYAHAKGVIHRDLKPANVMVGAFGEVYVMDWGVARAGEHSEDENRSVVSVRQPATDSDVTLATHAGAVVGTPSYMAPEQADGDLLSPRVDVYSVGAMLYHLLSRTAPFVAPGERVESRALLERVLLGPPRAISELDPRGSQELHAICAKAMAREPDERYATMLELADELRAYLEGRVVRAHGSGPLATLGKWIGRNRGLAAALASVAAVAALGAAVWARWRSTRADLELLAHLRKPAELQTAYEDLWPATPEKVSAMQAWLENVQELEREREDYDRELEALRSHALPFDPDAARERAARREDEQHLARARGLVAHFQSEKERLEREGGETWEGETLTKVIEELEKFRGLSVDFSTRTHPRVSWEFDNPEQELLQEHLTKVEPLIEELVSTTAGSSREARVRRGAEFAAGVRRVSLDEPAEAWARAIAEIRDHARCPQYAGLELAPQLGLMPVGRDPDSGLWEFAHLQSGGAALRGDDGRIVPTADMGIVLVLIPGGHFYLGAQQDTPERPNYDPFAQLDEEPLQPLSVEPFFLSKFELTQAQWKRWMGANPSRYTPESFPKLCSSERHPVENVSWNDAMAFVHEQGLTLPTEVQWEYAARAGTQSAWWCGRDLASLAGCGNLVDRLCLESIEGVDASRLGPEDGWGAHAPVGSFRPNPWGLHDTIGNVAEWCRDGGVAQYPIDYYFGTGERKFEAEGSHTVRGGSYYLDARHARSAARRQAGESLREQDIGFRPARAIDP